MTFESHNPATDELVGNYPEHDEAETNLRLQRAWDGWQRWSGTPLRERSTFLIRLADLLDARAESYGRLITAETGKPVADAMGEVGAALLQYHGPGRQHRHRQACGDRAINGQ
jgi:acyl-CoA reductase-like NAD-dependent aldehyde dehydrogenase